MNQTLRKPVPSLVIVPVIVLATVLAAGCASFNPGGGGTAASTSPTANAAALAAAEAQRAGLATAVADSGASVLRMPDGQLQINVPSDFSFSSDRTDIRPEGRPVLDNLAAALKAPEYLAMRIHIVGYTDSQGAEAANDALSLARAGSVRKHLESKGVAATRIEVEGKGARDPLAPNDKAYGRTLNRRIEIYLRTP